MGGSESRFIIYQEGGENSYITQPKGSRPGEITGYGARDIKNQYQKVVIKPSGQYSSIRYDQHPQNYIGVVDGKVQMIAKPSEQTNWKLILFQKKAKSESSWNDIRPEDMSLQYDTNKDCILKVAFYHPATKSFLNYIDGATSPQMLPISMDYSHGGIDKDNRKAFASQLAKACWCMECVATNVSAHEGIHMPNFPMIVVGDNAFSGNITLDGSPVVGVVSAGSMTSHGTSRITDQLENLIFDCGRSGMIPEPWENSIEGLKVKVAMLEAKVAAMETYKKV